MEQLESPREGPRTESRGSREEGIEVTPVYGNSEKKTWQESGTEGKLRPTLTLGSHPA